MPGKPAILDKQPGGWTLIVLLIVIAIIALLMALYLPSVLQMSSSPGKKGAQKPILEHVKEELAPIDQRNKQLEDALNQQTKQDQEDEEGEEDDYEE